MMRIYQLRRIRLERGMLQSLQADPFHLHILSNIIGIDAIAQITFVDGVNVWTL
jgi:hypothetical protein